MIKAVVLLGAVAVATAPTAPAQTLEPAPPEDPGVAGVAHCTVPAVRGIKVARAKRKVLNARCSISAVMRKRSSMGKGRVVLVVPRAGTILAQGTGVLLVVSSG